MAKDKANIPKSSWESSPWIPKWVTQAKDAAAGIIKWLVVDGAIDIKNIPDLDAFLLELRDKGLIGLANYNNGTMYYVPKDGTIKSFKTVSRIGSIRLGSDDDIIEGTDAFAGTLASRATSNLSEVYVLDGDKYVETNSNDSTFEIVGRHPECIKISWLQEAYLEARRVLYFKDDEWTPVALNFINDEGLPYKLNGYS